MTLTLAAALGAGATPSIRAAAPDGPATAERARGEAPLRVVALGDSLTSGLGLGRDGAYPALLEQDLLAAGVTATVINHGVSGDTTAGGVRRLEAALKERPDVLVLALGANDGLRGVPVAQVRANLARIIEGAQARGVMVLLCGMNALPLYGWQYTLDFHRVYPELAAKYNVPLVPFLLAGVVGNAAALLPDRVHPNAIGARLIADNIKPYLVAMVN